jgi:hypothetical protein
MRPLPKWRCMFCKAEFSARLRPRSTLFCLCGGLYCLVESDERAFMPATPVPVKVRKPKKGGTLGWDANGSEVVS